MSMGTASVARRPDLPGHLPPPPDAYGRSVAGSSVRGSNGAMFAALLALAALQTPPIHLSGVVVGGDQRPLAGARVLVACQPEIPWLTPGREVLADVETGADGAFGLDLPDEWATRQAYRRAELFVLAPGYELHTAEWSLLELPVGRQLRIALIEALTDPSARVRIVDDAGSPVREHPDDARGNAARGREVPH